LEFCELFASFASGRLLHQATALLESVSGCDRDARTDSIVHCMLRNFA